MATSSINGGYIINSASRLVTFPTWIECCLHEKYIAPYRCALGLSDYHVAPMVDYSPCDFVQEWGVR